jgi:hypothetical protein
MRDPPLHAIMTGPDRLASQGWAIEDLADSDVRSVLWEIAT